MEQKTRITVRMGGKDYNIIADESKEYIRTVADYVDARITDIERLNPRLNTAMSAALTALNIADELHKLRAEKDALSKDIIDYSNRVSALEKKLAEKNENKTRH